MSRAATMSVMGLYNWDNTLFDLMTIPEELTKQTLIDNLLVELAELEVIYPNPVVMKNLIGVWSAKQLDIWERLYATTQYEYNPIENYDRQESGTDGGTNNTTHTGTDGRTEAITNGGTDTRAETIQDSGTDTHIETIQDSGTEGVSTSSSVSKTGQDTITGTDTKGHWKAGFDSTASGDDDGLVKETRDQDDGTTTTQYGNTESGSGSSTTTFGKTQGIQESNNYGKTQGIQESSTYGKTQNVTESKTFGSSISETKSGTHTLRAHGNIGVTTTQEMIRQQREIEQFNLYDIIIDDFRNRFCILVY